MLYFILLVSILLETTKNIFSNHFSKTKLNTLADAIFFNMICSIGSVIFCALMPMKTGISTYSFFMSIIYAAVTTAALVFSLLAMNSGPMSYSVLFSYLGMVISTIFGVIYYKQSISVIQVVGFLLMIATFYIATGKKSEGRLSVKWFFYALMSFTMCGLLGVIQLLHQASPFAGEINPFMLVSFIFSLFISAAILLFANKNERRDVSMLLKSNMVVIGIVSGLFYGAINVINLYLSGKMASIIFFPVVNGGVLILSSLAAIALFKEKPDLRQTMGIITGIISVCLLGI